MTCDARRRLHDLRHPSPAGAGRQLQHGALSASVRERSPERIEGEQPCRAEATGDEERRRAAAVRGRQRLCGGEEVLRAHLPAQGARPALVAALEEQPDSAPDRRLDPACGTVRGALDVDRRSERALDAALDGEGEARSTRGDLLAADEPPDERAVGLTEEAARVRRRARARVRRAGGRRQRRRGGDDERKDEPHAPHTPPAGCDVTSREAMGEKSRWPPDPHAARCATGRARASAPRADAPDDRRRRPVVGGLRAGARPSATHLRSDRRDEVHRRPALRRGSAAPRRSRPPVRSPAARTRGSRPCCRLGR